MTLYVFNRSGLYYSSSIDIHLEPHTFVRLILGISCLKGSIAGFDGDVFFKNDERYIRTKDANKDPVEYAVVNNKNGWPAPFFDKRTITGRGTCCWLAVEANNGTCNKLVIKDAWRSTERAEEWELMKDAGIDGVAQMVAFEDDLFRTSSLSDVTVGYLILSRLTLELYGKSVESSANKSQLLNAFRDTLR